MAQAPDAGGGGAPRQNKTVKQFAGMNTQNQRNAVPEGQFSWLENIQPIGPGNLHSIPGRGLSVTRIPPLAPTACPDSAPGPQTLPVVCCYDSSVFVENPRGMFAHADDDGGFWHVAALASGFSSGPYPIATPTQTWYLLEPIDPNPDSSPRDCGLQDITALALPLPGGRTANFEATQTPQTGTCGKSDEKCYVISFSSVTPPVSFGGNDFSDIQAFFGADTGVSFVRYSFGTGFFSGFMNRTWCKFQDHLYAPVNHGGFGPADWTFCSWPLPSPGGTVQDNEVVMALVLDGWDNATMDLDSIYMIHATPGFLYVLARGPWDGGPTETRLFKINRSTLQYVSHWVLTGDPNFPNPWGIHAFSDDLIFMVTGAALWSIGQFHTASATTEVIDGEIANVCTPAGNAVGLPGQSGFYYAKNYFYLSYSGFGLGLTNVLKLGPLVCPSNPTILWQS